MGENDVGLNWSHSWLSIANSGNVHLYLLRVVVPLGREAVLKRKSDDLGDGSGYLDSRREEVESDSRTASAVAEHCMALVGCSNSTELGGWLGDNCSDDTAASKHSLVR